MSRRSSRKCDEDKIFDQAASVGGPLSLFRPVPRGENRASVRRVAMARAVLMMSGYSPDDFDALKLTLGGGSPAELRRAIWLLAESGFEDPWSSAHDDYPTEYERDAVHTAVFEYMDANGEDEPSADQVAKKTGIPENAVKTALEEMWCDEDQS